MGTDVQRDQDTGISTPWDDLNDDDENYDDNDYAIADILMLVL